MGKVANKEEKVMLFQGTPRTDHEIIASFDEHAVAIAKRQYFMPEDKDLLGMFRRVANWVASPEHGEHKRIYAQAFYDLMTSKRFCPGGRVLAGAGTQHGNVLNCFVQDGSPQKAGTNEWVTGLATKLALVTKVGGGNGLCLDPLSPKRPYTKGAGQLYVTIATNHADYEKVKTGTYMDLVHGKYVTKGYRYASFIEQSDVPASLPKLTVGDSVDKIWSGGSDMIMRLLKGEDVLLDLSSLRPEGTPVNGSGGNSSGPSSFAVEVFDNFAYWASLGGADYAGPVATLRYVFAPTLRVIRQGGCLHPDTLVNTSRGTLRLREIVDVYEYGWQDHKLEVATDEGWKTSPRGFNNGNAPTLLVKLDNGQEIQGTPNHKLKVMRENGQREWVRLEDLKAGDYVIQVLDQHTGSAVTLSPLGAQHHNTKEIKTPEVLSERLAFFLGYLWGDGFISDNRIGFAVSHDSPMMVETPKLFKELFDLEVRLEQKENDKSAIFVTRSRALTDWLEQNGLHKGRANNLELPRAIRQASRPIVAAFLRGLFEADGTVTVGYPVLSSSSKQLVKDVAVMLGGLGIPTTMRIMTANANRYSEKPCYHLKVVSAKGHERFLERVGYMEGSRFAALETFKPDTARESSWVLPHASALSQTTFDALPAGVKNHPSVYTQSRKTISRYIRGERQLTATGYERLQQNTLVADKLPEFAYDEYYIPVKSIEDGGRILTLDISVDENKTYLANGVVSHNTRRGAGMATMSITHPDIQDFITSKDLDREQSEGDISTFNISVLVTDGFMAQATKQGKQGVLWNIADHAWQTGEPGLIYIDRINEQNAMRETLGDIKSTNPCFPADVRIATSRGLVTLGELYETQEELMVMSDRRVLQGGLGLTPRAAIPVFKTGENKEIYRLVTKHGYEVRATHNHQFLTPNGWVELKDLQPGDTLFLQSAEGMWSDQYDFSEAVARAHVELVATAGSNNLWGSTSRTGRSDVKEKFANLPTRWSRELGTFMGFMLGDGFISEDKAGITFANADYGELASQIQHYQTWFAGGVQSHENCKQLRFGRVVIGYLKELGFNTNKATEKRVPEAIFHAPREAVVGFLQGLFTSDGTVNLSCGKRSCSIRLASSSKGLLQDVQMLLSNFGIVSRIYHRREAGEKLMPDGRGGEKLYPYADQYELLLDKINRDLFVQKIGFLTAAKQNRVLEYIASKKKLSDKEAFETTIAEIRFDGVEDVYDTTEPVAHSVIANGVIAHQCGEIPLYAGEPCDLGAINLAAYVQTPNIGMKGFDVEGFQADVRTCIRFLDNVLEVNKFALEDNRQMSLKLRRLGLGVMGLADALIMMGYRYDDERGRQAVAQMIGELRDSATEASEQLSKERGAFPGIKDSTVKTERRNVAVLTVAPTGTTSMLMGVSSGVEPVFAPFVFRKIGDSYASLIHPLFQELLERSAPHKDYTKDGKWDLEKVVQAVQDNHGSVQGLDFIPDDVKAVLICAHDISPEAHVRMQGVVQSSFDGGGKQIANSISKTINMPNEATVEDVFRAYSLAFETGCKGITVYRDGSRQFQVLSTKAEKKEDQKSFKDDTTTSQAPVIVTPPVSKPASTPTLPNALTASRSEYLPGEPLFERPGRLSGFTDVVKLMLPTGEKRGFYVTVNSQDGLPTEVFIVSGKAGDEANADSEALGRMVSIALQYGVPAEVVVKTLRGINGGMYGTYQGRMAASKADLIAIALETAGVQNVEKTKGGKSCPECGGKHLRYEEGCVKCDVCGYSKCG